jgi:Ribbon-helix-helix protein, copG family
VICSGTDCWRALPLAAVSQTWQHSTMKAITLKLPSPLDHRLTQFARLNKLSRSAVVRLAIEFHIGASAHSLGSSGSAAAHKWLGLLNGPANLSAKSGRLDNFGR